VTGSNSGRRTYTAGLFHFILAHNGRLKKSCVAWIFVQIHIKKTVACKLGIQIKYGLYFSISLDKVFKTGSNLTLFKYIFYKCGANFFFVKMEQFLKEMEQLFQFHNQIVLSSQLDCSN